MSFAYGHVIMRFPMKHEVPLRINVIRPLAGVARQVQRGRTDHLAPVQVTPDRLTFEFTARVDVSGQASNFLGEFAQGPKDARFVYVNSGTYAGQNDTCWSRRAKISLMSITKRQIDEVLSSPDAILETSFAGTGRDGGPACASVKGVEWRVGMK